MRGTVVFWRLVLVACVPYAVHAGEEADRAADDLRRLEGAVVATNEVERQAGRTALDALLEDTRSQQAERAEVHRTAAGRQRQDAEDARTAQAMAESTRMDGGAAAQRIRMNTAERTVQREAAYSPGAAFWDSLQYWTQAGLFEAGFVGGHAAGDAAFGDRGDRGRRWMRHRGLAPKPTPGAE